MTIHKIKVRDFLSKHLPPTSADKLLGYLDINGVSHFYVEAGTKQPDAIAPRLIGFLTKLTQTPL